MLIFQIKIRVYMKLSFVKKTVNQMSIDNTDLPTNTQYALYYVITVFP